MYRTAKSLCLALALIAATAVSAAAQDSVAGDWIFTMTTPQGMMDIGFTFEQNGSEVTGTVDLSAIPEVEGAMISDGVFEDDILFFVLSVGSQGQWFDVEIEADVDDDEMVGEAYMAEMGAAPFTAKRKAGD
jgi:hypothetical protein